MPPVVLIRISCLSCLRCPASIFHQDTCLRCPAVASEHLVFLLEVSCCATCGPHQDTLFFRLRCPAVTPVVFIRTPCLSCLRRPDVPPVVLMTLLKVSWCVHCVPHQDTLFFLLGMPPVVFIWWRKRILNICLRGSVAIVALFLTWCNAYKCNAYKCGQLLELWAVQNISCVRIHSSLQFARFMSESISCKLSLWPVMQPSTTCSFPILLHTTYWLYFCAP